MFNVTTKDPLYKGFTCKYCGQKVRTRQGLSGHIQFKHGIYKNKKGVQFSLVEGDIMQNLVQWKGIMHPSKFTTEALLDMFLWWPEVEILCEFFGLELNQQDLKNYVITSLANIRQIEKILQRLEIDIN